MFFSKTVGPVSYCVLPVYWTVMAKFMERNITNSIWILDTPVSLILSVCVAIYCKTCLILKKQFFIFSFCGLLDL